MPKLIPHPFRFLQAYTPLLNLIPGTSYPPALILTAESDDRGSPAHTLKCAATLQKATANTDEVGPMLLAVQSSTGHGEKPTEKIIEQASLTLAFLCYLFHPIPSQQGQPGSDMEK